MEGVWALKKNENSRATKVSMAGCRAAWGFLELGYAEQGCERISVMRKLRTLPAEVGVRTRGGNQEIGNRNISFLNPSLSQGGS